MAFQFGGAIPAPPGVEPNFIDPPSRQKSSLVQHATCLTLVAIFVSMRLYTRLRILKAKLDSDDYLCLFSYALDLTYSILNITACSKGIGRHMWDLPANRVPEAFKYFMFSAYAYILMSGCIKLTFLFCYRRIFSLKSRVRTFINLGIAVVLSVTAVIFFTCLFACSPVEKAWNAAVPGKCFTLDIAIWISSISSVVTDMYILVLPIVPLWRLNMKPKSKLKVMVAFSFGIIACAASIVRLGMTPVLQSSLDGSWNITTIDKWSGLEADVGIICSCLMLLPAFLNHHLPEATKALLSRTLSRISSKLSSLLRTKSASSKNPGNNWPKDKYQPILEGNSSSSIGRANELALKSVHVPRDFQAPTALSCDLDVEMQRGGVPLRYIDYSRAV